MPEETEALGHKRELSARFFAVGDVPYCVWDWKLGERNLEYLESLDPGYFDYVGRANLPNLEAPDPKDRQRAATAIRMAYHHGLESLFALLFAALQAPYCVVGWVQAYTLNKLNNLVGSVDPMQAERTERDRMRSYRERVMPYVWVKSRHYVSWEGISKKLIAPPGDEGYVKKVQENFGSVWSRFARDFLKSTFTDEYNSIKHGLRTGAGGFRFAIGLEDVPGRPAPPERMRVIGESEHGSSFFMRRGFAGVIGGPEEKLDMRKDFHFRVRRHHLNWDPKGLAQALAIISASIQNVRAFVQWMNGVDAGEFGFHMPPEEVFREPLGRVPGISISNLDSGILKNDVRFFEKEDLKREIAEGLGELREHLG